MVGKKLRVGVFGGARGRTMIEVLLGHPDAELVAVCDKYKPLLDGIQKRANELGQNVALFENFDDFANFKMDAVVLANYATEHAVYAVKLLRMGINVMSEVLPCETMAQAVELIEAVEASGKVYAYAENYCYMQSTFEMWQRYKRGDIGDVMYAEGEYVHDCSAIWPSITYGERDHWRNRLSANFYNTHSLGPILTITGLRPIRVTGFETPPEECMLKLGAYYGGGLEIVTLENGAVAKSIHGNFKREPGNVSYEVYGQKGMMESTRFDGPELNVWREGSKLCQGEWEKYDPVNNIAHEAAKSFGGHGGSDFYSTHFFIEKCLGRPDGDWAIDVYTAIDMGICGLLGYKSVLAGNAPIEVPNLRIKAERNRFRFDNACTTPSVAGDQLQPRSSFGEPDIPDEDYDKVREIWKSGKNAE